MGGDRATVEAKRTRAAHELGAENGSQRNLVRVANRLPVGLFAEGLSKLQQRVLPLSQVVLG